MRRKHVGLLLSAALLAMLAGAIVVQMRHERVPEPAPTVFTAADGEGTIELPAEPTPCPPEPVCAPSTAPVGAEAPVTRVSRCEPAVPVAPPPQTEDSHVPSVSSFGGPVTPAAPPVVVLEPAQPVPPGPSAPPDVPSRPPAYCNPISITAARQPTPEGADLEIAGPPTPEPGPEPMRAVASPELTTPTTLGAPVQQVNQVTPLPNEEPAAASTPPAAMPEEMPMPEDVTPPQASACPAASMPPPPTPQLPPSAVMVSEPPMPCTVPPRPRFVEATPPADAFASAPAPSTPPTASPPTSMPSQAPTPLPPSSTIPPATACPPPLAAKPPAPLPLPQLAAVLPKPQPSPRSKDIVPVAGTYPCQLAEHSELTLPKPVVEQLDKTQPRVLFVALAPDKKCLWLYTATGVERLNEQLQRAAGDDEKMRCTQRQCFSRLRRVQANSDGVFPLPVDLIETACLKDNVILIGVRDHFEVWDANQWEHYTNPTEGP